LSSESTKVLKLCTVKDVPDPSVGLDHLHIIILPPGYNVQGM
jgi:hypothetical protein